MGLCLGLFPGAHRGRGAEEEGEEPLPKAGDALHSPRLAASGPRQRRLEPLPVLGFEQVRNDSFGQFRERFVGGREQGDSIQRPNGVGQLTVIDASN